MTEDRSRLAELFAACWKDEALKQRFMSDTKTVLAEYGMNLPDGIDVNVVENGDSCVHITMPAPPSGYQGLSDEELSMAAGGGDGFQCIQNDVKTNNLLPPPTCSPVGG